MSRRHFLKQAIAGAGTTILSSRTLRATSPNNRVSVCVIGVRGRGGALLNNFASLEDVDIKYVCDIDEEVLGARVGQVESKTGKRPRAIKDYRRALEDSNVDAIVCGCPDHWHALPTIHACQAGKDVYVEKPDGHNILEGQTMVAAASKYRRIVQLGTQARSGTHHNEAMAYIRAGHLGKVRFAKAWESTKQGAIGPVPDSVAPTHVNYDAWLGPAPQRPFNQFRFHGNWRWFFDYGSGDLGNDGVHRLDIARWALDVGIAAAGEAPIGLPEAVSAHGGKYFFEDMQEWPDTLMVTFDFGGYLLTYEMRIWNRHPLHGHHEGAALHGEGGYVIVGNRSWSAFDERGDKIFTKPGGDNSIGHARNFIDCMRTRQKPRADLETVGHPSSLLCHFGNAAWRAGQTLHFAPQTYSFKESSANQFLTREEYREPYALPTLARL